MNEFRPACAARYSSDNSAADADVFVRDEYDDDDEEEDRKKDDGDEDDEDNDEGYSE